MIFILIGFNYIEVGSDWGYGPNFTLEDPIDGFVQMGHNGWLIVSVCMTIVSIAFFNYAGVFITKELNATTRLMRFYISRATKLISHVRMP